MKKMWLAGAAMLAGLSGFAGAALAQDRTEGADVSADTASRGRINEGDTLTGTLDPAGDHDWYRIRLQAGRTYSITLNGAAENGVGDPFLELYGANGGEALAMNDDANGSLNSELRYAATETGNYFVGVRGFNEADATGGYTLAVARLMPPTASARLAFGRSVSGALSQAGEKDYYSVRLMAGQTYRFSLASAGDPALSDPFINIYAPGGVDPVAFDDDGAGDLNSYLQFRAEVTGDYIVEARGYGEDATGGYTLTANEGDIPGDATTDASLNAEGSARADALAPAGDSDWYRLNLAEGQTVRIRLNSGAEGDMGAPGALADPLVAVHGADGETLATDDDGGAGLNSYLEFTAPAAGVHFVEARGFSDEAEGGYTIMISPGEIPGDANSDETVDVDEGRASTINANGDTDWFAVQMVEGRTYRIMVDGGEGEGMLADPMLTLIGPDGAEIAVDDDGGTGLNAYLTFTAPTTGVYYAAASAFSEGTGQYSIRVVDSEVRGDMETDETLAGEGDDRASRIDFPNDRDSYRLIVEAGASYTVAVTGAESNGLANPMVTILDQNGQEIASNDDIESRRRNQNLNSSVTFAAPADNEVVYAVVSGVGGATGNYTVTTERTGGAADEE